MKVGAIICPSCGDIIYSRARNDFHCCSCRDVAIDGGFDYKKVCFKGERPKNIIIEIEATKEELYDDWNNRIDKFGIIKKNS